MFALSPTPIDVPALLRELETPEAGGVVTFEGRVRDRNRDRTVVALAYEAYPELAGSEGSAILREATERFGLVRATCVHRTGRLAVGDLAIWIGVAAPHRAAAFEGCRYVIEQVKLRLPVWKQECYADGTAHWMNAS